MGFGGGGVFAAFMPVPEAAVDEDDGPVFRQHDVGFAGQVFVQRAVDGEAVAGAGEQGADQQFGLGVLALNLRHVPGALLFCEMINHESIRPLNTLKTQKVSVLVFF